MHSCASDLLPSCALWRTNFAVHVLWRAWSCENEIQFGHNAGRTTNFCVFSLTNTSPWCIGPDEYIYSPNEARAAEDLDAVPHGDEPRVQAQVVPLSAAGSIPAAPVPAASPSAPAARNHQAAVRLDVDALTARARGELKGMREDRRTDNVVELPRSGWKHNAR